jgi:hypothetical protein
MSAPVAATERVARPPPAHGSPSLRRSCSCGGTLGPDGECAACKAKRLARERSPEVPPVVHEAVRGPGRPLHASARGATERGFGHDFGSVRVHGDAAAAESARALGAAAYTVGRQLVVGAEAPPSSGWTE